MTKKETPDISASDDHRRLYQDLVETSQDLIWQCDAEGRYTYLNPAWETTFGYKIEEMLGRKFSDFQTPEMAKRDIEEFKRLMHGNMVKGLESVHIGKSGNDIHLVFNAKFVSDDKGVIVGTRGTAYDITKRKQAELSLLESEERFRLLSSITSEAIMIHRNGIILEANKKFADIAGFNNPKELIGLNGMDVLVFTPESVALIQKHMQLGTTDSYDVELISRDGHTIPTETRGSTITYKGEPARLVQMRDITERKQAEAALRDSEGIFNQFMSNSPVHVYIKDEKLRLLKLSDSFESLLGKPINELLGKDSWELLPLEFAESAITDDKKTLNLGKTVTAEEIHNGRVFTTIKFPIHRESGKPDYLGGFSVDITEQKQAERDHLMLSTLVHNSTSIFIVKDLHFRIITANKAFIQATGRNNISELIGKTDAEIMGLPEESEPFISYRLDDIKATGLPSGERLSREEVVPVPNKGDRTFLTQKFSIRNELEKVIGVGVISTDITEVKENEAIRERFNEKLNQIQKLESLGLLAGGIAHDFNNLMGGIFGYIDMASEATKEAKVTSYLSKALNTIERARDLTGQLLTFAKGGAPIQKIDNLFPFVEETAKFALSGANVSCNFDVSPDLWACNFDKNQLGQVIDNLIINAQQAMPVGGTIELTARNIALAENEHPLLLNGNYVKISVKDTGVGIPKELISKIFDPFFTTKAKGHGLGLATCHSIINRHGGCIDVESEPGKGSTLSVYLPASTEAATSVTKITAKMHKGSGTFLIMDDEEVMRDTVGDMLKTLGYTVISKENGRDAVDFFMAETKADRKIIGIIFDLTIPRGMGGKAAIEEIRKINTDIPAFVASGYADDPVMKNPAAYGFMASICKPFRKSELSEMLNKYMKSEK